MSNLPADLKYTKSHEWIRALPDGTVEIGITDHAQHELGDLVFVEVPDAGRVVKADEPCAVVESVKAASDVYAPIAGEITAGNPKLAAEPEVVNADPYGEGWLMRLRPAPGALAAAALLSAAQYQQVLDAEVHCWPSFLTPQPTWRRCSPRSAWRASRICSMRSRRSCGWDRSRECRRL